VLKYSQQSSAHWTIWTIRGAAGFNSAPELFSFVKSWNLFSKTLYLFLSSSWNNWILSLYKINKIATFQNALYMLFVIGSVVTLIEFYNIPFIPSYPRSYSLLDFIILARNTLKSATFLALFWQFLILLYSDIPYLFKVVQQRWNRDYLTWLLTVILTPSQIHSRYW